MKLDLSPDVIEALPKLRQAYISIDGVISVEPIADNRIVVNTTFGPIIFSVGRSKDGRLLFTELPATTAA